MAELLLAEGMSEYCKATPPSSHKTHMHHIIHYARCCDLFGPLNGFNMLSDERRNKVTLTLTTHLTIVSNLVVGHPSTQIVKDMARQRKHCEASIARVYSEHLKGTPLVCSPPPVSLETCCVHTKAKTKYYTNTMPAVSMRLRDMIEDECNGAQLDVGLWTIHKRAKIGGVRFTSGHSLFGVRGSNEK